MISGVLLKRGLAYKTDHLLKAATVSYGFQYVY